jgi:hypothetical protein
MTQNQNEMVSKSTELMAKTQEQNKERNEKFLPIFLWTD